MKKTHAYASVSNIYDDYVTAEKFPFNLIAKIIWGFKEADYTPGLLAKIPDQFSGILLDVPAGTGILPAEKYARMKKARIVCMDYSPDMLKIARERFSAGNFNNVSCVHGDAGNISFCHGFFDMVLSINGFHAFPDKEKAFSEVYRVLKPGGCFTGCFYARGITRRTDQFVNHVFVPNRTFIPPFYTQAEISEKLRKYYREVEEWNAGSIVCFHCVK